MATVKIKFRTSSVKTKEGVLFYQIIHARATRQINTDYKIFPSEWDKHLACIILPDNNDIRRRFLAQLTSRIAEDIHRLKNIISKLEYSGNPFTSGKIIELFRIPPSINTVFIIRTRSYYTTKTNWQRTHCRVLCLSIQQFQAFYGQ